MYNPNSVGPEYLPIRVLMTNTLKASANDDKELKATSLVNFLAKIFFGFRIIFDLRHRGMLVFSIYGVAKVFEIPSGLRTFEFFKLNIIYKII